ncbi:MAG: hypothetical protein ACYC5O_22085 [Anaerolineae bacterium]
MRRCRLFLLALVTAVGALASPGAAAEVPSSPYSPQEFIVVANAGGTPGALDIYGDWVVYQVGGFGGGISYAARNLSTGATFTADAVVSGGYRPIALWQDSFVWATGSSPITITSYNLSSGQQRTLVETANHILALDVWGNRIVWLQQVAGEDRSEILSRDLSTGQDVIVSAGGEYKRGLRLWNDLVVWEQSATAGGQRDILGYRFSMGEAFAIAASPWDEYGPAVSGSVVVWTDAREGTPEGTDIYGLDLATGGEPLPICTAAGSQEAPDIWGDLVVWQDSRDLDGLSGPDVYGYDLALGQEFAVTRHIGSQGAPAIFERTVVWTDWRNSPQVKYATADAYGARLASQPGPSPLPVTGVPSTFDGLIEVVWPHSGKPGTDTDEVNIGAFLFSPAGSRREVPCAFNPPLQLWMADGSTPAELVAEIDHRTWSIAPATWHFNDVDVRIARDPLNRLYFFLRAPGDYQFRTNVWSHAADARTFFPNQKPVAGVEPQPPMAVDAVVQIVWPHDNLPVAEATAVNVSASLFAPGTSSSVPADWNPVVVLYRSLNNGIGEPVATGVKRLVTDDSLIYPAWDFNDVDVVAARDPLNKYYFRIEVEGIETHSTIWAHGADARTYFPTTDTPECYCNQCR